MPIYWADKVYLWDQLLVWWACGWIETYEFTNSQYEEFSIYKQWLSIQSITVDFNLSHSSSSRASTIIAIKHPDWTWINKTDYAIPFVRQWAQYSYNYSYWRYWWIWINKETSSTNPYIWQNLPNLWSWTKTNAAWIITLNRNSIDVKMWVTYWTRTRETSWNYTTTEKSEIESILDDPWIILYNDTRDMQSWWRIKAEVTYT